MIELANESSLNARIVVVGVGGGGGNALSTMIRGELSGVDFIAANTDSQALSQSLAATKIQLGCAMTKGLGAGANPEVGRKAALEQEDTLREELADADMVFVTAGMGGGTGTGAAPVIARIAKDLGALTVGVVTKPFSFEGRRRLRQGEEGIRELRGSCDTLIAIPNQRLIEISGRSTTALEAFQQADDVLLQAVRGISQIITEPGLINVDFADVRTIMAEMGMAMMGAGVGYGDARSIDAATAAISSPLLEDLSIGGARGVLANITASEDFGIQEMNDAVDLIQNQAHEDANIIVGLVHDPNLEDEVRITVIATGFGDKIIDRVHKPSSDSFHGRDLPPRAPQQPQHTYASERQNLPSGQSSEPSAFTPPAVEAARPTERDRLRMLDESLEEHFDDAPATAEPEMAMDDAPAPVGEQEDFEFATLGDDEDKSSMELPAYLRRWRQRGSGARR